MAFGAFAPLPLRLGGDAGETGWRATEHARACADVSACWRTAAFARLAYTTAGGGVATVSAYTGRDGVGVAAAPAPAAGGVGDTTWTFDGAYLDAYGDAAAVQITKAQASCGDAVAYRVATATIETPATVRVRIFDDAGAAAEGTVSLTVYARPASRRIGHYGGALDKEDSITEGETPYAWQWYLHVQSARGSAYSRDQAGLVHVENLALARSEAARWRAGERAAANRLPGTAYERLGYWARALGVDRATPDVWQELRTATAAKLRLGEGPTIVATDSAVSDLLGDAWVRNWRREGADLATPPASTYWPGVSPGPAAYDLGSGAWLSERCHLVVETQIPSGMTTDEFLRRMNRDLYQLLDDMLPSSATFNWAINVVAGFLLDIDDLDFGALGA